MILAFLFSMVLSNTCSMLRQMFDNNQLMGMSFELTCNKQLLSQCFFGYQDITRLRSTNKNTKYRIAQVSKIVTAISILKIVQDGFLTLQTDVNDILPFQLKNPWFPDFPITVGNLLSHQSSITEGTFYNQFLQDTYKSQQGSALPKLRDVFELEGKYYSTTNFMKKVPGSYFQQCNLCYIVLGNIIQIVSNTRFDIFVDHQVLKPLNISNSFNLYKININDLAVIYRYQQNNWIPTQDYYPQGKIPPFDFNGYQIGSNAALFSPQGGLRITTKQLAKLIQNYIQRNNDFALNSSSIKIQSTPHYKANRTNNNGHQSQFNQYGLGLYLDEGLNSSQWVIPHYSSKGHMGDGYGLKSGVYAIGKDCHFSFAINGGKRGYGQQQGVFSRTQRQIFEIIAKSIDRYKINNQ